MADIRIKLLLVRKSDRLLGNGLNTIRKKESELIDITDWDAGMSDATNTMNVHRVIKDNIVYEFIKSYFDLDNNWRIILAKEETEDPGNIVV